MIRAKKRSAAATAAILAAAILMGAQAGCGKGRAPAGPGMKWHHSLNEALEQARNDQALVLVNVSSQGCPWCRKLENETLTDAKVRERLRQFVLLKVDAGQQPDLAIRLGADQGVPLSVVLDAEGNPIAGAPGYMPPESYLKFLAWAEEQAKQHPS